MRSLLFALLLTAAAQAQTPFCAQLQAITQEPALASAHWGVSVTTLDGQTLCAINEGQLFRPASTAKLFTMVTALSLFAPDATAGTEITTPLKNFNETLGSDLTLKGHGDAFLSTRPMPWRQAHGGHVADKQRNPLEAMADAVAAKGIRHITGDVVGDDTDFPYQPINEDWSAGDTLWGYGAPVSALTIEDNKMALTVTPTASAGGAATASLDQLAPYYQLQPDLRTIAAGANAELLIERRPGTRTVRIAGSVAQHAAQSEDLAVDDPALYAAIYLKALLQARGIQVDGVARAQHRALKDARSLSEQLAEKPSADAASHLGPFALLPTNVSVSDAETVLASHRSPTLLDDVTLTLKVSQNLHAELLLHRLGRAYGDDGSTEQGCRVVRRWMTWKGNDSQLDLTPASTDAVALDPADFYLNDGSGLSTHDLVAPRAFTKLLQYAARQKWFASFKAALPLGGTDGTLAARFTASGSSLKGRVFAKTGTLGESRALAGYVATTAGATLVFAIMEDTHMPGLSADRGAMDRMVEVIASQN